MNKNRPTLVRSRPHSCSPALIACATVRVGGGGGASRQTVAGDDQPAARRLPAAVRAADAGADRRRCSIACTRGWKRDADAHHRTARRASRSPTSPSRTRTRRSTAGRKESSARTPIRWASIYSGMLLSSEVTGDKKYADFAAKRYQFFADNLPALSKWPSDREAMRRNPFRNMLAADVARRLRRDGRVDDRAQAHERRAGPRTRSSIASPTTFTRSSSAWTTARSRERARSRNRSGSTTRT